VIERIYGRSFSLISYFFWCLKDAHSIQAGCLQIDKPMRSAVFISRQRPNPRQVPIIPRADLASPVANALRERLVHTTWGKTEIPAFDTVCYACGTRCSWGGGGRSASHHVIPASYPMTSLPGQWWHNWLLSVDGPSRLWHVMTSFLRHAQCKAWCGRSKPRTCVLLMSQTMNDVIRTSQGLVRHIQAENLCYSYVTNHG
jgi:hypothetical protein